MFEHVTLVLTRLNQPLPPHPALLPCFYNNDQDDGDGDEHERNHEHEGRRRTRRRRRRQRRQAAHITTALQDRLDTGRGDARGNRRGRRGGGMGERVNREAQTTCLGPGMFLSSFLSFYPLTVCFFFTLSRFSTANTQRAPPATAVSHCSQGRWWVH